MGLLGKKISDVTVGEAIGIALFIDFFRTIGKLISGDKTEGLDKNDPDGFWNHPYCDLIFALREKKFFGETPAGGWNQFRKYELYLRDVIVVKDYEQGTLDWPGWMRVTPQRPQNYYGDDVTYPRVF